MTTLKRELKDAKDRIHADGWSFELHVEESLNGSPAAIQETDPTFVEALAKETSILKKRVDACKNHAPNVSISSLKRRWQVVCLLILENSTIIVVLQVVSLPKT